MPASLVGTLRAVACNNAWANHRLLAACAGLMQAAFEAPRTSFFPSFKATPNHILVIVRFYVDAPAGGKLISRVDERSGLKHGQPLAPHGLAADSRGDLYVGEVSWTVWEKYLHPGEPVPKGLRSLQKLVRVAA